MIPYKQLTLADFFTDCQEKFENDKPAFLTLLETHINLDEIIPVSFKNHFYASTGRTRKYPLHALLWALIIQRIFSIPTDQLLLVILQYSKPLRDFCGFTKVPDASKITRFKQDFLASHPDIVIEKKSDSPDEDKSVSDCKLLIPTLKDFFSKHPLINPKTYVYDKTTKKTHHECICENPCTSSSCGRMIYVYPEKDLRAYPGVIRGTQEWDDTYKIRTTVERDINHIKENLCLAGHRTQNAKTLHADLNKQLCAVLGVSDKGGKPTMFLSIREQITYLYKEKRQPLLLAIDEAQYLNTGILNDIKMLMNYGYDSVNYFTLILCGESHLNDTLRKPVHEALRQRITVHYNYNGLSDEEVSQYILHKIKLAGSSEKIIDQAALSAVHSFTQGNPRLILSSFSFCF